MAVSRNGVLLFAVLFLFGVLIFVFGPVATCAYKHHSFAKNVKVQISVPSCLDVTPASKSCQYVFSLDGERDSGSVRFGSGLRHEYDPGNSTFTVSGLGEISHHRAVITVAPSQVSFNDQPLPTGNAPIRVLVKRDGGLVSGYCELRWQNPGKLGY
jgi:hypothetical protein